MEFSDKSCADVFVKFSELNCTSVCVLVAALKRVAGLGLQGSRFRLWEVVVNEIKTLPGRDKNDQRLKEVTI